ALEQVDVAQDQGQGTTVACRTLDLAGKMLAEEAAAGDAGGIVGGRELAVLGKRDPQHRFQLRDAPRRGEARIQLPLSDATPQALVGSSGEACGALDRLIELRHVQHEGRALGRARSQTPDQLQAVGDDYWVMLG